MESAVASYRIPNGNKLAVIPTLDRYQFKLCIDVQEFKPEELKVRIVSGYLLVEGMQEDRSDQYILRKFVSRYRIPQDVDISLFTSRLSSDGLLSLAAPRKIYAPQVRNIPIMEINQPVLKGNLSGLNEG